MVDEMYIRSCEAVRRARHETEIERLMSGIEQD